MPPVRGAVRLGSLTLLSILVLSEPTTASMEGWSVSSLGNPSFKRQAGTDGFVPLPVIPLPRARRRTEINGCPKLGSEGRGLRVRMWVFLETGLSSVASGLTGSSVGMPRVLGAIGISKDRGQDPLTIT